MSAYLSCLAFVFYQMQYTSIRDHSYPTRKLEFLA